jgi:hypothetical protein
MNDNQIIDSVLEEKQDSTTSVSETVAPEITNDNDYLEIKYNKEQIRIDREQAKELAQKGMNYEKAVERARQEARDSYISEQGYEWNGKAITTESDYQQALKEKEMIEQYQQKDLPDEVIQELVENRKFRENYEKQQNEIQTKTQRDRDFQNFLEAYPDTKADSIPLSVWETVEKGESLVNAYMRYENQLLKQKLNIEQKNQENVNSSIGAVRSSGTTSPFYTREQVSKMSTAEVNQNWKQVQESMKKW